MTPEIKAIGDGVIASVKEHVARALAPLLARLDQHARRAESTDQLVADLERRLAELERRQ